MFLETITAFGYEALVPVSRIKCISVTNKENWIINIYGIDDEHWVECFELKDEDRLNKRLDEIKKFLNPKTK